MKKYSTDELRQVYLDYFVSKNHSLVGSDALIPKNDTSVLFTSAGMNQFKEYFLGERQDLKRATSCQKCLRTGDLEEVGRTPFHHTFFEMLGNFSFGDYFKKEAIEWGWDFVTKILQIDEGNLWVSVYEDDSEAYEIWRKHVGLSDKKIKHMGPKDNFWPANAIADGPNGPCGPCSEIYYQKGDRKSVEVWNLVFTQFNRSDGGKLAPLPMKNIDTGMGLERMSSVLQGVESNFDIDIFSPIVGAVRKLSGLSERRTLNMIADHARAVVFCIGDGIIPSNDGRGYVVRKLIRRCLHMASALKQDPFLYGVTSSVAEVMGGVYPEILKRSDNIASIIRAEEERFIRNILKDGRERMNKIISSLTKSDQKELPASEAVDLYVTHGVALDYTFERCEAEGIFLDMDKAKALIEEEVGRTRKASKMSGAIFAKGAVKLKRSKFVGYEQEDAQARIVQIIQNGVEVDELRGDDEAALILDKTPFYAEGGGQAGDAGLICCEKRRASFAVTQTQKDKDSILHIGGLVDSANVLRRGDSVAAQVDAGYRQAVKRAHTATHILQAVLRDVLGAHVQQAGSFVEPDRLRFDFTHFKDISDDELARIQVKLNDCVIKNDSVAAAIMLKEKALKTGAMALFGEKYEDKVRVVSVGEYSREFCGGTHLSATGEIGFIFITGESSVGSGLRRIEALTGPMATAKMLDYAAVVRKASEALKTQPEAMMQGISLVLRKLKASQKSILSFQEKGLKEEVAALVKKTKTKNKIVVVAHIFDNFNIALLRSAVDFLKKEVKASGAFLLASVSEDGAQIVCGFTQDLVKKGFSAQSLMKDVLGRHGGSGGGRGDFAQGGVKTAQRKDIEGMLKELSDGINQTKK